MDEVFEPGNLFFGVLSVVLDVDLKMVALDKDRPCKAFFDCGGKNDGGQFGWLLEGVTHFRLSQFKNKCAGIAFDGGAKNGPAQLIRHAADVEGGNREPFDFAPTSCIIKSLNR